MPDPKQENQEENKEKKSLFTKGIEATDYVYATAASSYALAGKPLPKSMTRSGGALGLLNVIDWLPKYDWENPSLGVKEAAKRYQTLGLKCCPKTYEVGMLGEQIQYEMLRQEQIAKYGTALPYEMNKQIAKTAKQYRSVGLSIRPGQHPIIIQEIKNEIDRLKEMEKYEGIFSKSFPSPFQVLLIKKSYISSIQQNTISHPSPKKTTQEISHPTVKSHKALKKEISKSVKGLKSKVKHSSAKNNFQTSNFSEHSDTAHLSLDDINYCLRGATGSDEFKLNEEQWFKSKQLIDLTDAEIVERLKTVSEVRQKKEVLTGDVLKETITADSIEKTQEFYSTALQGTKILDQIGTYTNNSDLKKVAAGLTHLVTGGFAAAALFGNAAAIAAIGVVNPVLLFGMAAASVLGLHSLFGGDDDGGEALSQIYQEVKQLQQILSDFRDEFHKRMDRSDEFDRITIELIKNLYTDITNHFDYLHHSSTIPTLKKLTKIEAQINALFGVLDAKIGHISLQPLVKVFFEINPYLNGVAPLENMMPQLFDQHMGILNGHLHEAVKGETFTHEVILSTSDSSQHPVLVYETLGKISKNPVNLPNYIGLMIGYMQRIGILTPEEFPKETLFNVLVWYKALQKYLVLKEKFPHFTYDSDQAELGKIRTQALALQNFLSKSKSKKVWSQLWAERELAINELNILVDQTIAHSEHKLVAQTFEQILQTIGSRISPINPNFQDLKLEKVFKKENESNKSAREYLSRSIPGLNVQKLVTGMFLGGKEIFFNGHGDTSVKKNFDTKNPLILAGKNQEIFSFLASVGLKIPTEFLLAEFWNIGHFSTVYRFSLLNYRVSFGILGRHITALSYSDAHVYGAPAFGLDMNFHIDNQAFKIFQPKPGFLHERNLVRKLDPIVPAPTSSILNDYEQHGQTNGQNEWVLLTQHAKEVVFYSPSIHQSLNLLKDRLIKTFLNKRLLLSRQIISAVEQSAQMNRVFAIEQLMVSYAIFHGLPAEYIDDLFNTLIPHNKLAFFNQSANGQASIDLPITLNLPSSEKIEQLKTKMLQAEYPGGVTEHYLKLGIGQISKHQLQLEMQKFLQIENIVKHLQNKILGRQQTLSELQQIYHAISEMFSYVQSELMPSAMIQEVLNTYSTFAQRYEQLLSHFEVEVDEATPITPMSKTEEKEIILHTSNTENLQNLYASPSASLSKIRNHLKQLEKEHKLESTLNSSVLEMRPLHLAIKAGRKDVVTLLLEHGAVIDAEAFDLAQQYQKTEISAQISAILEFYQTMHTEVSGLTAFEIGRTLGLIHSNLAELSPYGILESANLIFGNTGEGKTTLANVLAGVDYEVVTEDGQRSLKVKANSIPEIAVTSASSSSETTYPQIIHLEQGYDLVDMPGITDNRGLAFNIANGLSALMLSKVFKSLRSLIVVVDASNIYQARSHDISNAFDMLGKIIHNQPALISNIILVVNKATSDHIAAGPAAIQRRLNKFLKENPNLQPSTQFLLNQIRAEQIVVVDVPTESLRTEILNRIEKISAKPFDDFNFADYHREVTHFQNLLTHMQKYQVSSCNHLLDLINSLGHAFAARIENVQPVIDAMSNEKFDAIDALGDLKELYQQLKEIFRTQEEIKDTLKTVFQKVKQFVAAELHRENSDKTVFEKRHLSLIKQSAYKVQLVKQFMEQLAPIAAQLNLTQISECAFLPPLQSTFKEETFSSNQQEVLDINLSEVPLDSDKYIAAYHEENESVGSSWPLPGAAGLRLPRWYPKSNEKSTLVTGDASQTSSWFSPSQWFSYAKDTWNSWVAVTPVATNTTTSLANIEPTFPSDREMTCQMMPLEERFVFVCPTKEATRYIYPKISSATDLVVYEETMAFASDQPTFGDTYNASTCKVAEFYGQPAVYCDGEKTVMVTVPRQQTSMLNANLMLAIWGVNWLKQNFGWFGGDDNASPKTTDVQLLPAAEVEKILKQLEERLEKLKALPLDKAEKWALAEHEDSLAALRNKQKKGVSFEEIEDLKLDIAYFENEVNEIIQANDEPENGQLLVLQEPMAHHLNRFGIFGSAIHAESSVIQRRQNLEQNQAHFLANYR